MANEKSGHSLSNEEKDALETLSKKLVKKYATVSAEKEQDDLEDVTNLDEETFRRLLADRVFSKEDEFQPRDSPPRSSQSPTSSPTQPTPEVPLPKSTLPEQITEEQFYSILSHDIRRQILRIIGKNRVVGFSSLKRVLKVSTGTIYHHLDTMKEFIAQNAKKQYLLTPLGEHAFQNLTKTTSSLDNFEGATPKVPNWFKTKGSSYLLLSRLLEVFQSHKRIAWCVTASIAVCCAVLCGLIPNTPYLFFFTPILHDARSSVFSSFPFLFFLFLGEMICVIVLIELFGRILFNRPFSWLSLTRVIGIVYIPVFIYLIGIASIKWGFYDTYRISDDTFLTIYQVWLVIMQVWVTLVLTTVITKIKSLRFERGLIIAVFLDYGIFLLLLVLGSPLF